MDKQQVILIVDDDPDICSFLEKFFTLQGFKAAPFHTFDDALSHVQENQIDVMITDLDLKDPNPAKNGIGLLKAVKEIDKSIEVIIMTGYGTIENAVEAMQQGAFHYVRKPISEIEEIKLIVMRALERKKLNEENFVLRRSLKKKYKFKNFIGDSEPMQRVFQLIEKVADSDSTILIQGENGTGKELVAQAIHYNSNRRDHYFVPVNCAALPQDLLESELFGHEKGSFTNAVFSRKGRFEQAHGGTLFLDEIGDMAHPLQAKVLRVIQEKEVQPVGSKDPNPIKVDVRLIAATNQNLEKLISEGKFRKDLYFRLNVIPIYLPPLRERRSDIPLLIRFFLEKLNKEKKKHVREISREAEELLCNYDWPGNVRELENLIERLVILNDTGIIEASDLPEKFLKKNGHDISNLLALPKEGLCLKTIINTIEDSLILQALQRTNGNKNKAAELLNLNRTTLVEKLKKKNLDLSSIKELR